MNALEYVSGRKRLEKLYHEILDEEFHEDLIWSKAIEKLGIKPIYKDLQL